MHICWEVVARVTTSLRKPVSLSFDFRRSLPHPIPNNGRILLHRRDCTKEDCTHYPILPFIYPQVLTDEECRVPQGLMPREPWFYAQC